MAKKLEIDVVIDVNGDIKADVVCGPGGAGCEKELDKLLGGVGRKIGGGKKPEFFQAVGVAGQTVKK